MPRLQADRRGVFLVGDAASLFSSICPNQVQPNVGETDHGPIRLSAALRHAQRKDVAAYRQQQWLMSC